MGLILTLKKACLFLLLCIYDLYAFNGVGYIVGSLIRLVFVPEYLHVVHANGKALYLDVG